MKNLKLTILSIVCLGTFSLAAANRYVATNGNDNNAGTISAPWKTIQKSANSALAGDIVYIRQGTYFEKVDVNVSGTATGYITFRNYQNEIVTIDGTGTDTENKELLEMYNRKYIKIIGLHLKNNQTNFASAVYIGYGSSYIEIRNCVISNINFSSNPNAPANETTNANPLVVYGSHPTIACNKITIDGNEIFNCRTGYSEALALDGNVTSFVITNNHVHHISNIGIDMAGHFGACPTPANDQARSGICRGNLVHHCGSVYAAAAGIYIDGGKGIVVEKNVVHHCQYGIEVGCEQGIAANGLNTNTTSSITVRNNLVYKNGSAGITFGGYNYPTEAGRASACKFYNNTLYQNDTITNDNLNGEVIITASTGCQFKNNIIYASANKLLSKDNKYGLNLAINYNTWYTTSGANSVIIHWTASNGTATDYFTFATYKAGTLQDANSVFGNPNFVNAAAVNFHISNTSAAYNVGDPAFVTATGETDIDGQQRKQGVAVDCGYDEVPVVISLSQTKPDIASSVSVFPNPVQDLLTIQANDTALFVRIADMNGRVYYEGAIDGQQVIDCSQWPAAIYTVMLQDATRTSSQMLVKW